MIENNEIQIQVRDVVLFSSVQLLYTCSSPVLHSLCNLTVLAELQSEIYYVCLLLSLIFAGFDSVLRDWISVPLPASV